MAVGQAVFPSAMLDVAEVDRLSAAIQDLERARSVRHGQQLSQLLELDRVYTKAGMELGTAAQAALLLNCSEYRATGLLADARALQRLGALTVMRDGLLTVEQARVVVDVLGRVEKTDLAVSLWERLHRRLLADAEQGAVLPPARFRELLQRWLLTADPGGAVERRKKAQRDSNDVEVWRREDGLNDLALRGLTGPNTQAILGRISAYSDPIGPYDERTEGERRLQAATDLLLGRIGLPFPASQADGIGAEVPSGAQVFVHVPLPTALGASDEPAELVGHGPIDRDLLQQLLLAAPVLHRVWVDPDTGVPVAVDDRTWQPPRRDPEALRAALLDMGSGPPPPPQQRHPVHPDDHDPDPRQTSPPRPAHDNRARVLTRPHLAGPDPYTPSRREKRLVRARAPRCEWPGCGRRALAPTPCDVDHDLAWPYGPTCACHLGPLCRRHHRIKQLGWAKQRRPDGSIRWTSPTGRSWTSRPQHPIPRPTRPVPPLEPPDPLDQLTQWELDEATRARDPEAYERRDVHTPAPEDIEPADNGPL